MKRKGPTQDEDLSLHSIDLRVFVSEIHMFSFFVSAAQLHSSTYIRVEVIAGGCMHEKKNISWTYNHCLPYVKPSVLRPDFVLSLSYLPYRSQLRYSCRSTIGQQRASRAVDKYTFDLSHGLSKITPRSFK